MEKHRKGKRKRKYYHEETEMVIRMNQESTLRREIEQLRKELNEAAFRDLSSEECFRISLQLDDLLEKYYNAGGAPL